MVTGAAAATRDGAHALRLPVDDRGCTHSAHGDGRLLAAASCSPVVETDTRAREQLDGESVSARVSDAAAATGVSLVARERVASAKGCCS